MLPYIGRYGTYCCAYITHAITEPTTAPRYLATRIPIRAKLPSGAWKSSNGHPNPYSPNVSNLPIDKQSPEPHLQRHPRLHILYSTIVASTPISASNAATMSDAKHQIMQQAQQVAAIQNAKTLVDVRLDICPSSGRLKMANDICRAYKTSASRNASRNLRRHSRLATRNASRIAWRSIWRRGIQSVGSI